MSSFASLALDDAVEMVFDDEVSPFTVDEADVDDFLSPAVS